MLCNKQIYMSILMPTGAAVNPTKILVPSTITRCSFVALPSVLVCPSNVISEVLLVKSFNKFLRMKMGEMISHLHNQHQYNLVVCLSTKADHCEHSADCFKLPNTAFLTVTDTQLCQELLKATMPLAALVEY